MTTAAQLLADALALSEDERVRLAEELLLSVQPPDVPGDDDEGRSAMLRARAAEVRAGDVSGQSWADVRKDIERE